MTKRKDIRGNTPEIGDIIVYNPPYYKGITEAYITGFMKSGLPTIVHRDELDCYEGTFEENLHEWTSRYDREYTGDSPKTEFIIIERHIGY